MPRKTSLPPLQWNASGLLVGDGAPTAADFAALAPQLAAARQQVLADATSLPAAAFLDLPDRLLAEYQARRTRSLVGRLMKSARRLGELVDRVVVLGAGGAHLGPSAIVNACGHPFHNDLSRGGRGGHPRLYFAGHDLDNDRAHGLLDLLRSHGPPRDLAERWGMVIIDRGGRKLESVIARQQLLAALRESCGGDERLLGQLVIPITAPAAVVDELGCACAEIFGCACAETYCLPDGLPLRAAALTAAGLLPAALLGLDAVKLLEGAAAANARFRAAPSVDPTDMPGGIADPALGLAAAGHLMNQRCEAAPRVLTIWHAGLEATGLWYESLLSESLMPTASGGRESPEMTDNRHLRPPRVLTAVQPRDALTREPQPGSWAIHVAVDDVRQDRLRVGPFAEHDALDVLEGCSWPELTAAAAAGMQSADKSRGIPAIELRLPRLDEASLGQLVQTLLLSVAVEGRLGQRDPYRRSVVPEYRRRMNAHFGIRRGAARPGGGEEPQNRDNG